MKLPNLPALVLSGVILLLSQSPLANAAVACTQRDIGARPSIALVLGGGGARGAAHIGVIRALEEMRIPVDYIAGTSMGAIVGALMATGMNADEMEEVVTAADWEYLFKDDTARKDRPIRRKSDDRLALFGPKLGVSGGGSLLPKGAISGQKISFMFETLTSERVQTRDFDQLPIPYRAVAADILTGNEVVLDSGSLGQAMRASMALPGIFSPVEDGDYLLIDGGVVNNLPVSVAHDLGAEIVIAIDVGSPLAGREDVENLVQIIYQLSSIMVEKNVVHQTSLVDENDFLLVPELGTDISSADFDRADEAIVLGYAIAQTQAERLSALSLSEQQWSAYRSHVESCVRGEPTIEFVEINNTSRFDISVIESRLHVETGKPLDIEQLSDDLGQIYALGFLQEVRYEIVEKEGQTGLYVDVSQDDRGTGFLEYGLDLITNNDGSEFNVRVGYLKTDIDKFGSEFRVLTQIGQDLGIFTELYKPINKEMRWIAFPSFSYQQFRINEFDNDGRVLSQFEVDQAKLSLGFGREIGRHAAVFAGLNRANGNFSPNIGLSSFPTQYYDDGQFFINARYDRLDNFYFPGSGAAIELAYHISRDALGADTEYDQVAFNTLKAWTTGSHSFLAGAAYETTTNGIAPVQSRFRAGGFGNLSGYALNELAGQHFGMVLAGYRHKLGESGFLPAFIGGTIEYGNVSNRSSGDVFSDGLLNGSVYLGYNSPIGPMYLGYGMGEGDRSTIFLRVGNVFGRNPLGN